MKPATYKRRKPNGLRYPHIPYEDQDYGTAQPEDRPFRIREVLRMSFLASTPQVLPWHLLI